VLHPRHRYKHKHPRHFTNEFNSGVPGIDLGVDPGDIDWPSEKQPRDVTVCGILDPTLFFTA